MQDIDREVLFAVLDALGGGLLVGIERERSKGDGLGHMAAGVRTYALVALSGPVAVWLGSVGLALARLAVVLLAWVGYRHTRERDPGLTSEVTLVLVFLLGALAAQRAQLAAALFVATAILLASKHWLHHFTRQVLSEVELDDLLLLAASVLIVLPLLPDHTLGPFGMLNPRKLWLLVVLVMAINAAGYIALRALGAHRGLLLAGFLGGFVSSAATIGSMGQRASALPQARQAALAAALLSNMPTAIQIAVILAALAPELLRATAPALVAAGLSASVVAAVFVRRTPSTSDAVPMPPQTRPFDLGHALLFAAIVAAACCCRARCTHGSAAERSPPLPQPGSPIFKPPPFRSASSVRLRRSRWTSAVDRARDRVRRQLRGQEHRRVRCWRRCIRPPVDHRHRRDQRDAARDARIDALIAVPQ